MNFPKLQFKSLDNFREKIIWKLKYVIMEMLPGISFIQLFLIGQNKSILRIEY